MVLCALLALAGCGGHKSDPYATANLALLANVPVYPGAAAPKTSTSTSSDTEFSARDWTLPKKTDPETVIGWYVTRLQKAGWKIVGKNAGTIRGVRGTATLDVGVRGRTLEAIVDSRGKPA